MNKCNHPNCNNGVLYNDKTSGVTEVNKCPYCKPNTEEVEARWQEFKDRAGYKSVVTT